MERRRAVLVGAGGMGRTWARNLLDCEQVELVGWVDIRPEAVAEASAALGLRDVYVGPALGEALRVCQADFVVDVSIPEAHHDITLEALAAGLPVLGEKPMADSLERARAMVAAAERAGKLYMVSQSRRYNPQLATLRDLIAAHLGPLGLLNTDFYLGPHFGGFRETMPSPLLLDMAIHTFDAARCLSRADPVSVYCEEFNPPWSWYAGASCAVALFEMSGGLRYTYRGGWSAEGRQTSWEGEWRAIGSGGTATWDGVEAPLAEVVVGREGVFQARGETPGAGSGLGAYRHRRLLARVPGRPGDWGHADGRVPRQHQEPGHGLRRHRIRLHRASRADPHLSSAW
ncbi:MAG TPA: Gfo/Idh/MocA family oxidoreductase [Chloroflexota bacterium]